MAGSGFHADQRRRSVAQRDLALATWGLFTGLALLLLTAGLFGTLLGVRSELVGLPTVVSSLISSSYYLGFLVGFAWRSVHSAEWGTSASTPRWPRCFRRRCCRSASPSQHQHGPGFDSSPGCAWPVSTSWPSRGSTTWRPTRTVAGCWPSARSSRRVPWSRPAVAVPHGKAPVPVTGFAIASIITSLAVAPVALSEEAVAPGVEERTHIWFATWPRSCPPELARACSSVWPTER